MYCFLKKRAECRQERPRQSFQRLSLTRNVRRGSWQYPPVPRKQDDVHAGKQVENNTPGISDVAGRLLEITGDHDQKALPRYHRQSIKGIANTNEPGLIVVGQPEYVKAVCSNIVGR